MYGKGKGTSKGRGRGGVVSAIEANRAYNIKEAAQLLRISESQL